MRCRNAPGKFRQAAEVRVNRDLAIARFDRADAENVGREIIGWSGGPRMAAARLADRPAPGFPEGGVLAVDLRAPIATEIGNQIAPARARYGGMQDAAKKWLRSDDVGVGIELHIVGGIQALRNVGRTIIRNGWCDHQPRLIENVFQDRIPPIAPGAAADNRDRIGLLA